MSPAVRRAVMPLGALVFAALVVLVSSVTGRADLIIFKDGFSIEGRIKQQTESFVDPNSHEPIVLRDGFFLLDAGYRRVLFSPNPKYFEDVKPKPPIEEDQVQSKRVIIIPGARPMPAMRGSGSPDPWDAKWDRAFHFVNAEGTSVGMRQHLSVLTPTYARVDATSKFGCSSYYSTQELGPSEVKTLLDLHPDFKETKDTKEADKFARRFRRFGFYMQAGWTEEAGKQLDELTSDFPAEKEKVESARVALQKVKHLRVLDDLHAGIESGRHGFVRANLAGFPETGADEATLAEVRTLRSAYDSAADQLKQARAFFDDLASTRGALALPPSLVEATRAVRSEMGIDDFLKIKDSDPPGRLDIFLIQARQAERQRGMGRTPDQTPAQIAALAVTAWLLGNTSAEAKPEVAEKLWKARRFLLGTQKAASASDRENLLAAFKKEATIEVPEMAQLISLLPPPDPEPKPVSDVVLRKAIAPGVKDVAEYHVLVPPEYRHGRDYPLLIVLHTDGESPDDAVRRWANYACRFGYIVAAPHWQQGLAADFHFSPDEHQTVLDTLRDLRYHYRVDSDRVFLAGVGQGAMMAFDVGLSHPDLFAGVAPMSGGPMYFAVRYWRNGQYLPFYVVNGDQAGEPHRQDYNQFKDWVPHGYPAIYVIYKGRGAEWFGAELANLFDWMGRKRRANPLVQLGRDGGSTSLGDEFRTSRLTDNRFYWLGADLVSKSCLTGIPPKDYKGDVQPATLCATIEKNNIIAHTFGVKTMSIWLGKGMIDFDRPVTVIVNTQNQVTAQKRKPSLDVLVEDFYQRADRQRVYYDKITISGL
jgi:pimeloyl-ACP methyl ester carboxylesterase